MDIDNLSMGELIRAKDDLLRANKISMSDYETITKYLGFIINGEVEA